MPDIKRKPRIDTPATEIKKGKGKNNVEYKIGDRQCKVGISHINWKKNSQDKRIAKYQAIIDDDTATQKEKKEARRLKKRHKKYQTFYKKIVDEYNAIGQT
jgi:hypothetical protein